MTARSRGKRGNGEGSIYRRESDGKWCASLTLDNGRRKVFYGRTREEVAKKLRTEQNNRDEGTLTTGSATLAQFKPQYLAAAKARSVRPRTLEAYEERLNKHILPTLGRVRLDKLTATHVERLYADKLAEKLSPSTVGMIHQVLHSLLKLARRRKLVGRVVTHDVDPPKVQRYQARTLTLVQARALLRSIRDERDGPFWAFLLGTGCRFGEAAGLTWADDDLDAGVASIRQAATRHRTPDGIKVVIDPVKTDAGNRQAPLPAWVMEALRAQRPRVAEMRLAAGAQWSDRDLVFPNRHGEALREAHVLVRWHRALEKARMPDGTRLPKIRMHDLRHTKGTLMIDEGEELVVVQRTLGHARQSTTADLYIGKVPKALRRAADRYGELLDPGTEATG